MRIIRFLPILILTLCMINTVMDCGALCEEITLAVGESKIIGVDGLQVGFTGIALDCRCPIGLLCVWEGDAVAELWADLPSIDPLYFELHSNHVFEWQIKYDDYLITLKIVEPYPYKDIIIDPDEYIVTLDVSSVRTDIENTTWGVIKTLCTR